MPDAWWEAMLEGAFERAWTVCDAVLRERAGRSCAELPPHLRWVWDGSPLAGRRVLVRCYHGLGDTLQFIRFVAPLSAIAASVCVEAQPVLLPLLLTIPGAAFYPLDAPLPAFDVAIESMELPHALRVGLADLPGPIPYLRPDSWPANAGWQPTLGRRSRSLRVGLVWAAGDWRVERSIPPALLLPLTQLPIELIGLQLGAARQAAAAADLVAALHDSLPERPTILETASLLHSLDLLVTVDTMAAHLAGALGLPVWTLLDADADWRWMRHRSDTPWYPTMRLFRQERPGAWESVIAEVAQALAHGDFPAPLIT